MSPALPMMSSRTPLRLALATTTALLLAACQTPPPAAPPPQALPSCPPAPAPEPAPACPVPAPVSVVELIARPAEKALLAGLRAYDDGQYKVAEQRLGQALKTGLAAAPDQAAAHKTLAFVYCSSQRLKPCEAAFRAARAADPGFSLSKSETGHPIWGPVWKRVSAEKPAS
jgi:hypothetical protein